jgi:membrane-bound serine protease (ClpP class)
LVKAERRAEKMTWLRIPSTVGVLALSLALLGQEDPLAKGREALGQPCLLVAHVEGDITPDLVESVQSEVRQWLIDRPAIKFIVFQIHTRGGDAFAAHDLAHFIHTELKDYRTVAFIPPGKHALSAGALIAVSAKEIVMGSDSRMGAAAPVTETTGEELGEKEQALIRSYFRGYANDAGYRTLLTDAMVSKDHEDILKVTLTRTRGNVSEEQLEFYTRRDYDNMAPEVKVTRKGDPEVILPKGRLLVMNEREAQQYGFVKHPAEDLTQLRSELGILIADENVVDSEHGALKAQYPAGQALIDFCNKPVVRFLLLLSGCLAFLIELKTFGLILPGTVALACFAIFFVTSLLPVTGSVEGTATFGELLLFVLGLVLLGVEFVLLPGMAIFAITGAALCAVSLVLAMVPGEPSSMGNHLTVEGAVSILAFGFGAGTLCFLFLLRFLPHNPIFARKGLVSQAAILGVPTADSALQAQVEANLLLGKKGIALTQLRPAGKIEIEGGRLLDVVADGGFIEKGSCVQIIETKDARIVVAKAQGSG